MQRRFRLFLRMDGNGKEKIRVGRLVFSDEGGFAM